MRHIVRLTSTVLLMSAGCGWFDDGRKCSEGASSCDGDRVQLCVPLQDEPAGANGPKTTWSVTGTCEDDPVRGPLTCGLVAGEAQCVSQDADGGLGADSQDPVIEWQRVDVATDGGSYAITKTEPQYLKGSPVAASSGPIAAVSYVGGKPRDAVLVPVGGSREASVWLRSAGASTVRLVDASGKVLHEVSLTRTGDAVDSQLGQVMQGLGAKLPPTLRVIEPSPHVSVPDEWRGRLRVTTATPEALELAGRPFMKLPLVAASALTALGFATDGLSEATDGGVPTDGVASVPQASRTALSGTTLWINATADRLQEYRQDTAARAELELEIVRRAGEAFAWLASVSSSTPSSAVGAAKLPTDFPQEIAALIQARITPMLVPGESFASAWSGLHQVGVDAHIAGPYEADRWSLRADLAAVEDGFASSLGGSSPELDFATYLAYATLQEAWTFGPCGTIRDAALDELSPRLLVPVAKLHVLWGVGVLDHDFLDKCVGSLDLAAEQQGFVLHKASGEAIDMREGVQAARTPYYHGEIHISASAQRSDVAGVLDIMYRDQLPGVIRLKPTANGKEEHFGAMFALAQPRAYSTSPAAAGLVVVTKVTHTRLEARALLVRVAPAVFGASIFPLVTVTIDNPIWPEDGAHP